MTEFSDLGLSPATLKAVAETGYTTATPIQAQAIPFALHGRDVLGIAQTGTGKTAAFTLPMIDRLSSGRAKARMPRALVIEPTRELADQVASAFEKYAKGTKLSWALLIGGVSMTDQVAKLDRGVDVLIATPGRLLDLFERSKVMLNGVQIMVVDEADRMLDMGFIPDLERIFQLTPPMKQTLFFSATMPPEITRLTKQFLKDPERIEATRPATTADTITQYIVRVPASTPETKRDALRALIGRADVKNGIVFCNRKSEVDIVAKSLVKHGLDAAAIHGDLDQSTRTRTLDNFRKGELRLLVASDVAARGLDIPDVSHVFNYDVPHHADDYVHRIGRTGRAGKSGQTFMIVGPADSRSLDKVLKLIGKAPEEITLDIEARAAREPREGGRGRERTPRPRRDTRERPRADHGERAPLEPLQAAAPPAEAPQAPAALSEKPVAAARPEAPTERPRRRERQPERQPERQRESSPGQSDSSSERPRRRERQPEREDSGVVGFGSDMPAFLMRSAPKK
jgi:superfamily II DNA/RNA helicase